MNVFEDLLVELRDENLLEGTVLDLPPLPSSPISTFASVDEEEDDLVISDPDVSDRNFPESALRSEVSSEVFGSRTNTAEESESEFKRKWVREEISMLQMVGQVLAGIEREYLKTVPRDYDDLNAKKALHRFIQASVQENSEEVERAEAELQREIAEWSAALVARDRGISTAAVRRYCENSKPPLSSQALIAMGRFYLKAPYSESARAKFDFVLTRLFCRDVGDDKRVMLFERGEMVDHIRTFYANWSGVPSGEGTENDEAVRAAVGRFDELIREAEQADSFDRLTRDDFFDRIHKFKESLRDLFYSAEVVSAAIECNVRIGNTFVDLLVAERGRDGLAAVEERYGYAYNQVISQTAGKTLHLLDVVKSTPSEDAVPSGDQSHAPATHVRRSSVATQNYRRVQLNKWLLLVTAVVLVAGVGIYVTADSSVPHDANVVEARQVDLRESELSKYFRMARASEKTFYLVTRPEWDQLAEKQKRELVQAALKLGETHGADQVQFVDSEGRSAGYATRDRVDFGLEQ